MRMRTRRFLRGLGLPVGLSAAGRREKYRYLEPEREDEAQLQHVKTSQPSESKVIQIVSEPIQYHRLKRLVCRIETALAWNSVFSAPTPT
jgi:hypothetical protein